MAWRATLIVLIVFPLKSELLPIRTYTTADGLAADQIARIVADSRGFLWFCTHEGLSRFDGYRFVTYGEDAGLPHAAVNALIETALRRSLDRYVPGTQPDRNSTAMARFTNYQLGREAAPNNIVALLETRSGKLWGATPAGLFEWTDPTGFRRREFPPAPPFPITDLAEDANGDLWVGTTTGIYIYQRSRRRAAPDRKGRLAGPLG